MTDEKDATVHPAALLIPAKLNGTLSARESGELEAHLAGCAACRRELEEYASLRAGLAQVYAGEPGPSPQAFRRVMADVARTGNDPGPGKRLDAWLRALFGAPWAPTFAAALLVAQFGLLAWVVSQPREGEVLTRSVGSPSERVSVSFRDTATDAQIRALLREVGGRIVDGPSAEGRYIVEITSGSEAAAQARGVLRRRTDIVRSVE